MNRAGPHNRMKLWRAVPITLVPTGLSRRKSRLFRVRSGILVVTVVLLTGASVRLRAQQTIVNVPSSDVLPRGKVYGELNVNWKPVNPKFSSFFPRFAVGVGGRVELGFNVIGNIQPGDDVATLVPALKWKAYDGGGNGWAFVVGDHIFVPVRNKSFKAGNYVYAQVSKSFSTNTRITAGGYHASKNVVAPDAHRAGGQFGFEQTVNSWFGVAADWFTGKHASGYLTAGIGFKPHAKVTGSFGYSIGNTRASNGNHFFYTAIGINFN